MTDWRQEILEKIAGKDLDVEKRSFGFASESQKEYIRRVELFHNLTLQTKLDIEKVFNEARQNGLTVTSAHEMFVKEIRHKGLPKSNQLIFKDTSVAGNEGYEAFEIWGYKWRVDDPELLEGNPLYIYLYLEESLLFYGKVFVKLVFSTSAIKVEVEIKSWMESNYRYYGFKKK